jgi:SET domain
MAGCPHGVHAGVCGGYGSAEKTRQIIEATVPKGGRGRAVHVRRVPSRPRAHESQCVTLYHRNQKERARTKRKIIVIGIIDLKAHWGLYTLHSHMNHNSSPNVSMRHLDQRTALSRITVIAKRDIVVGEELVVTYVDPTLEYVSGARSWLHGDLGSCEQCRVEEERQGKNCEEGEEEVETKERSDMDDLEIAKGRIGCHVITGRLRAASPSHFITMTRMRRCPTNKVGSVFKVNEATVLDGPGADAQSRSLEEGLGRIVRGVPLSIVYYTPSATAPQQTVIHT